MKNSYHKFIKCLKQYWNDISSPHVSNEDILLLNDIISRFIGTFDKEKLKYEVVNYIGKIFKADRCFIDDYDPINNRFITPEYEYLSSPELKSFKGLKPHKEAPELNRMALMGEETVFSDRNEFLEENNLINSKSHQFLKDFGMKSCAYMPIKYNNEIIGMLGIVYVRRKKFFRDTELELIRKICGQIALTLEQITLSANYEKCAEREMMMRKIVQKLGSTLDIEKIKHYFVTRMAKYFRADRVALSLFDREREIFLPFDENSEYLQTPEMQSLIGYDWSREEIKPFIEPIKQGKEVNFSDFESYIKENNLEKTRIPELFLKSNICSSYNIPVMCSDKIMGYFCIDFKKKGVEINRCEMNFLRVLAEQLGITLYQIELYEKSKEAAEKEQLLINIISVIRSTLDINEIKTKIVEFAGEALNADRCIIDEFDNTTGKFKPAKYEYVASPDITSIKGFDVEEYIPEICDIMRVGDELLAFDLEEYFRERGQENCLSVISHKKNNIKSDVAIPIIYADRLYGTFVLHYTKEKIILNEDQLDFIRSLATQTGNALYQAELYEKEKQTAEREELLRKIISIIQSTMDINEIKKTVVKEIGKALNADRCVIYQVDTETDEFMVIDENSEYLSSPDIKSHMGINLEEEKFKTVKKLLQYEKQELIIPDVDNHSEHYDPSIIELLREYGVKSNYTIPIIYNERVLGILYINFVREKKVISEEELKFFRLLAAQAGIAIYRTNLYSREKRTVDREKLLRKIIEATREIPDLKKVKQKIVNEVGKVFNADRCYFRSFDKIRGKWLKAEVEYRASPDIISVLEAEPVQEGIKAFIDMVEREHRTFVIKDREKYLKKHNLEDSELAIYLRGLDTHSDYPFPIWDRTEQLTYMVLHYTREPVYLSDEDIKFLETVASQAASAIDLTEFYENIHKGLEREKILREISRAISSSLDISHIKKEIVKESCNVLKASRTLIFEMDKDKNVFLAPDEDSIYIASGIENIFKEVGTDFEQYKFYMEVLRKKSEIIQPDTEKAIIEENLQGTEEEKTLRKLNIKGVMIFPILYMDEILGGFAVHFDKPNAFGEREIQLARDITAQAGIAIYQAELYETQKQTAQREKLLRESSQTIGSTLDINRVKQNITESFGRAFNLDRCFILGYDPVKDIYLPADEYSEYRSSDEIKSVVGFDFSDPELYLFIELGKKNIDVYGTCTETDFVQKYKREVTPAIKRYFENFSVKSCFQASIFYADQFLGLLVGHNIAEREKYSLEDRAFIKSLAKQTGIAVYQARLYETVRKTAERERLLRGIIEAIRSSLDIDRVLLTICDEVAKTYNVQRATIVQYPDSGNYQNWVVKREYKARADVKGLSDIDYDRRAGAYIGDTVLNKGENLVLNSISESDTPDFYKDAYRLMGVKSALSVPIKKGDDQYGIIYLSEYDRQRDWTQDEISLLEDIADQTYFAIKQAELYEKESKTAQRERLIRRVVETMGSTLDIQKIKQIIVKEVGKAFNADRAYFRAYDKKKGQFSPPDIEYIRTPEISSLIGEEPNQEGLKYFFEEAERQKNYTPLIVNQELLDKKKLRQTPIQDYFNQCGIKTDVAIPMWDREDELYFLVLHYINNISFIAEELVSLMEMLAKQLTIAIERAKLYEDQKLTAERERLIRSTIQTIRSTLDIKQLKREIVREIGLTLKPDRVFIIEYDTELEKYLPVEEDAEYLSSPGLLSFVGENLSATPGFEFIQNLHTKGIDIIYSDVDKFIEDNNLQNTKTEEFLKKFDIKTLYALVISYRGQFLGNLVIQYTKKKKEFDGGYLEYVKALADQLGIAIWQAKLYEKQLQTAEKERILKELVGEIRLSQSIEDVYRYIITKIAGLFGVNRCFFLEITSDRIETPLVKHEYLDEEELKTIRKISLPENFLDIFKKSAKSQSPIIIRDLSKYSPEDNELQLFLKNYQIQSMMAIPLIRYNMHIRILGILALTYSKPRQWTNNEIEILKAIADSVVRVVWEITKIQEIDELRDTFMLTLAHDLQVPLIGEKKAIEYLLNRPNDCTIGTYKDFIETMAKDNAAIINMLKRLLDVYNFEAGRKEIKPGFHRISEIIDTTVSSLNKLAEEKSISVKIDIQENLPPLQVERDEIKKVIYIILENAFTYTQENGLVEIRSYRKGDSIITLIKDNGPGIPKHIQKKLFQRYAMVETIERKIGSGLGLYLSKEIIEAHNGKIWYETEVGKGTTFCFSLPIRSPKFY